MANKEMKTLAFGDVTYEIVDEKARQELSEKGKPNGIPELDETGKVPVAQLPELGVQLGETSETAFRGDHGKIAYAHAKLKGNKFESGLYKITTNDEGHVVSAELVTSEDIIKLGIPDKNTTYDVGGEELGLVKNGGDVTINTDGTMTAPEIVDELDKKANVNNPVFTGSISLGRRADTPVGEGSVAMGINLKASGKGSNARGLDNIAGGEYSTAGGVGTIANGYCSYTEGYNTRAWHPCGHAEGYSCISDAYYAHAEGFFNNAGVAKEGMACHVEGGYNESSSAYQHVQGKFNKVLDDNYAFIIGNGRGTDNSKRSNAHTVKWSGDAWYRGSVTSNGEDYAEFFEWQDGNVNNEDRIGLLVTLDGEKIRLANTGDELLGIISGTVAVLGGNYECEWNKKYLTDDFGRVIYDEVEEFVDVVTGIDEETNEPITEKKSVGIFKHPRINPDYDPEQKYINRTDRPEWDTVGMLGKLYVRDDGTCQVNGYATVGENGVAIASSEKTNMRVLSRVNENIVRVLLK